MIKNYEIPAGQYAGLTMLFSIVALAVSMLASEVMGSYWWTALGITAMIGSLILSLSKSHEALEGNRQSYIQYLDDRETSELTQALEDPKTTETTRKFILSYLNKCRSGWASSASP